MNSYEFLSIYCRLRAVLKCKILWSIWLRTLIFKLIIGFQLLFCLFIYFSCFFFVASSNLFCSKCSCHFYFVSSFFSVYKPVNEMAFECVVLRWDRWQPVRILPALVMANVPIRTPNLPLPFECEFYRFSVFLLTSMKSELYLFLLVF